MVAATLSPTLENIAGNRISTKKGKSFMNGVQGEQGFSIYRLRWVGYGLLVLSLLDTIAILTPPQLLNPVWELQTIGNLVERVPVPLLGLALIFFGEDIDRTRLEDILLKVLSWLCLISALIFLLMLPLGIFNTIRINGDNNKQINAQAGQQLAQLQQVEERISKGTPEDLKTLAGELNRLGVQVDAGKPEELKTQILSRIPPVKQRLEAQKQSVESNQRLVLLRNAVKWLLGALIASVLFFTMWKGTDWAR